jgi:hypothetical protein
MNSKDEQARRELAASLPDKELYRALWSYDEVEKVTSELRDMMALIWPGDLLTGMSLEDIQAMLKAELARRQTAKNQGAS